MTLLQKMLEQQENITNIPEHTKDQEYAQFKKFLEWQKSTTQPHQGDRNNNVLEAIMALQHGQPYKAWHYISAGTGTVNTCIILAGLVLWAIQIYGIFGGK